MGTGCDRRRVGDGRMVFLGASRGHHAMAGSCHLCHRRVEFVNVQCCVFLGMQQFVGSLWDRMGLPTWLLGLRGRCIPAIEKAARSGIHSTQPGYVVFYASYM